MTDPELLNVRVGDIIMEHGRQGQEVVTQVQPTFCASRLVEGKDGETRLGFSGTVERPIKIVDHMALGELSTKMLASFSPDPDEKFKQDVMDYLGPKKRTDLPNIPVFLGTKQ